MCAGAQGNCITSLELDCLIGRAADANELADVDFLFDWNTLAALVLETQWADATTRAVIHKSGRGRAAHLYSPRETSAALPADAELQLPCSGRREAGRAIPGIREVVSCEWDRHGAL
jgi:hypothetical protein